MVTSVNRLVAAGPHSAAHVEAPDPDIIMRHDPSDGSNENAAGFAETDRPTSEARQLATRARPVCATPTSSDGSSATALPDGCKGEDLTLSRN